MKTIRIANPRPGQARFTSERAARKYVERRKIARWVDEGKNEIFFYDCALVQQRQNMALGEVASDARRLGKVLFWNGTDTDPVAIHRPGEVRC